MKRRSFFVVAAIVPGAFGLVMMLVPDVMLGNSLALDVDVGTIVVTRWVGFAVFSLACINMLARRDPGSPALGAIILGNIVFHSLGLIFDVAGFTTGTMTTSGMVSGVVPHGLLLMGFLYYAARIHWAVGDARSEPEASTLG